MIRYYSDKTSDPQSEMTPMKLSSSLKRFLRRFKLWQKILLIVVIVELALHIFVPGLNDATYYQYAIVLEDHGFDEDSELFWKPSDDFAPQLKRVREYAGPNLIYTLGGSIAWGWEIKETFSRVLERELSNSGVDAAVVNFGVEGYATHQNRVLTQKLCEKRPPDILLLANAYNDTLWETPLTDREAAQRNQATSIKILYVLNRSRLFVLYRHLLLGIKRRLTGYVQPDAGAGHQVRAPLPDYRENLDAIARLGETYGFSLVLIAQPLPKRQKEAELEPYFQVMWETAEAYDNVFTADPRPLFAAYRKEHNVPYQEGMGFYPDALFLDHYCHPTVIGHQMYATAILQTLRDNKLLKQEKVNGNGK